MAKFMPLKEAVHLYLKDGNTVAFEGFTHLIPYAAAHEAIRQNRRHLTLIRMTPDVIYDQMIGLGMADKLIFSYAGNPGVGLLQRFRDAVEKGWPKTLTLIEHSHAALASAYEAGAAGLPMAVMRGYRGAELRRVNQAYIKTITCPFSGEALIAVPAIRPEVSFIHAIKADARGNVLIEGIVGVQKEAVLAAKHSVVTVEEVVPSLNCHPNAVVLPHWSIDAICVVPGGAHPSYAHGYYLRDNAFYIKWDKIARDREKFQNWVKENILDCDPDIFASRITSMRKNHA